MKKMKFLLGAVATMFLFGACEVFSESTGNATNGTDTTQGNFSGYSENGNSKSSSQTVWTGSTDFNSWSVNIQISADKFASFAEGDANLSAEI